MRRVVRVCVLLALLLVQSGAVDRAYSSPARTPNYPGVDVSNGCYIYTDGKIFCNDGGYALSGIVPQYVNQKVQIVLVVEVQGALQVCLAGSCVNASNSEVITFPEFGETPYGSPDLLQVTCISGPVRWYISQVNLIPISVPATDTPTPTVNPSSTATNTVVPGSTDTPIPTSTPRGLAATLTPSVTSTAIPTSTPNPHPEIDCGDVTIPLLNCNFIGAVGRVTPPDHWQFDPISGDVLPVCSGPDNGFSPPIVDAGYSAGDYVCSQSVVATEAGFVNVQFKATISFDSSGTSQWYLQAGSGPFNITPFLSACPVSGSNWCYEQIASLSSGGAVNFAITETGGGEHTLQLILEKVWISSSLSTPTPGPATDTPTPIPGTPTDTPYPIPGASLTPYPSPTACSGGACAVEDSTQIPAAIDTVVGIDTSPLTPLELLSVGRTSCQSFGAIPLVEPHLYGTPIYGSSQPISITWTVPATGTQFQPCADPSFSSAWWDTMWNLSILVAIVCWIGWLIHWVRSLFS